MIRMFIKSLLVRSEQDVENFEKQYNIKLPADFSEFTMSSLGGLYMEVREEIWPQAKQYDVGPFWSFCRGIVVYGIADKMPEELVLLDYYATGEATSIGGTFAD